jgi:hypothetical protein
VGIAGVVDPPPQKGAESAKCQGGQNLSRPGGTHKGEMKRGSASPRSLALTWLPNLVASTEESTRSAKCFPSNSLFSSYGDQHRNGPAVVFVRPAVLLCQIAFLQLDRDQDVRRGCD